MIRSAPYWIYDTQPLLDETDDIIANSPLVHEADVNNSYKNSLRKSKIGWIPVDTGYGKTLFDKLMPYINNGNTRSDWNFDIEFCESLQYTIYNVGDTYDWHIDYVMRNQSSEKNRKISFTVLLNDDFKGGEFELEWGHPNSEDRHIKLDMKKGDMLLFPSYTWHRVNPVTEGVRKSLVGWVNGPNWK